MPCGLDPCLWLTSASAPHHVPIIASCKDIAHAAEVAAQAYGKQS